MSAPRWKPPNTGLQIAGGGGGNAPTSAYQQVLAAMPPDMARGINNSPLMTIMHGHQAGHTMLAKASEGDINRLLIERNIIDQPVTIEGGGGGVAKNPFFKELWEEKDYGTRNQTIADLKKNDRKQYDYLSGFESAWLEETPVTTPTDLTIDP